MTRALVKFVEQRAFALMRRVLAWRGRDLTDELTGRSFIVVAPHPDDETLGCGATIARAVEAGRDVRVVVVTDGRHSHRSTRVSPYELGQIRRAEVVEASRVLGLSPQHVIWLGCEDGQLERDAEMVRRQLTEVIEEFGPGHVLAPSAIDEHADHRALASVVRGLVADGTISCPVYEYPVWFFHARTWLYGERVTPSGVAWMVGRLALATLTLRPVTVRTSNVLERKRQALATFTSQMTNLTGEPGWVTLDKRFLSQFLGEEEIFFLTAMKPRDDVARGWSDDKPRNLSDVEGNYGRDAL